MSDKLLFPARSAPAVRIPRSIAASMTGIEWCDFTANAWGGCTEVLPVPGARSGCAICYARTFVERKPWGIRWGAHQPRQWFASYAAKLRRLNAIARATGHRFAVFGFSLADWLDPEVDPAWREHMALLVEECDALNHLLLTHRPHLARRLAPAHWRRALPAHVWAGVTVDHMLHAKRWDQLAEVWGDTGRAWVSAEPLSGRLTGVDLSGACTVIVGGASNTTDPRWALDPVAIEELAEARGERGIFFKQWGVLRDGKLMSKKAAGRDFGGRTFDALAWPLHRAALSRARETAPQEMAHA